MQAGGMQATLPDSGHLPCAQGTRGRPQNTRHTCSPCVAHGESTTTINHDSKADFAVCLLSGVFGPAHGKLKHMTAGTSTWNGNGARRRRRIRSSPCAMDPGTRQRLKKIKKDSATAAARRARPWPPCSWPACSWPPRRGRARCSRRLPLAVALRPGPPGGSWPSGRRARRGPRCIGAAEMGRKRSER